MWGGHSCPPTAATKNNFTRTTLRETTETSIRLSKEDLPPGKLTKEEQRDDAGQFVGKRAGSARAGMREERSDDRSPATAPASTSRLSVRSKKPGAWCP